LGLRVHLSNRHGTLAGKCRPQIRSAPDYEITGRPNSPPPELLAPKIWQLLSTRNTTFEGGYGTKEPLAKFNYFGTILELLLVTCQPLQVLIGVSRARVPETSPRQFRTSAIFVPLWQQQQKLVSGPFRNAVVASVQGIATSDLKQVAIFSVCY
jgi:hypothetical protein